MNKLITQTIIIIFALAFYLPSSFASIKCWVNDAKVRECSFTVPKKYQGYEIQILNSQGQVIKVIPAEKSPEQKKKEAAQAKIDAEKKRLILEQRRKDRILVNTFLSVDDIILSRNAKITAIDAIISITKNNRSKQQKILNKHTTIAGNFERKSNKVPQRILDDIDKSKEKIKSFNDFIHSREQEKIDITKKYDADIKRFKELKAIKPR